MRYVLGVEGDNLYTRYMLFDTEGGFIGQLSDGTCSPDALGFEDAAHIIKTRSMQLLSAHRVDISHLSAAAFGLAGVDSAALSERFTRHFREAGFPSSCRVTNDTFLGVLAGTKKGAGVCTINGAGTATGGIDEEGKWLQIGGLGPVTGDEGGGGYLAEQCLRKVYDELFRCGEKTMMTDAALRLLGVRDKEMMLDALAEDWNNASMKELTRVVFAAAEMDDAPALSILRLSGREMARSAAGCVRRLTFRNEIEVVLAGGVWRRAENPVQIEAYKSELKRLLNRPLDIKVLELPAIAGAVRLAMQLSGADMEDARLRARTDAEILAHAAAGLEG